MSTRALCLVLFLAAPLSAHAGSGEPWPTVCAAYESSPLIFRARVLQTIAEPPPGQPSQGWGVTVHSGLSGSPVIHRARLQVLELFKGDPGPEITVVSSDGTFSKGGGEFLVYAQPNAQNALVANTRARTNTVAAPYAVADLAWLRAYPTAPPTASIFGSVTMNYGETDIPPISVTLTGPSTLTALPAADHTYAFKDLAPGAYTVTAVLPAGYTTTLDKNTAAVTVAAKGCAEIDFPIRHDTHIRGCVTDTAGNPTPNVSIGLLRPNPSQSLVGFTIVSFQQTGADGRYDLAKADPGDYWVALNYFGPNSITPYVPVYYPSGPQASAQLIHLGAFGASAMRDNINLVLPPPLTPVTLHVHVVNPDGSPVIQAKVSAIDPLTPIWFTGATADANGDATITLYEGRTYSLEADTSGYREPACAGPVKFIAKEGLELGTLTLDKTINACRALQHSK